MNPRSEWESRCYEEGVEVKRVNHKKAANDVLDARVLAAVIGGSRRFSAVHAAVTAASGVPADDDRAVDRSLQRLRKRNAIRHGLDGWVKA